MRSFQQQSPLLPVWETQELATSAAFKTFSDTPSVSLGFALLKTESLQISTLVCAMLYQQHCRLSICCYFWLSLTNLRRAGLSNVYVVLAAPKDFQTQHQLKVFAVQTCLCVHTE